MCLQLFRSSLCKAPVEPSCVPVGPLGRMDPYGAFKKLTIWLSVAGPTECTQSLIKQPLEWLLPKPYLVTNIVDVKFPPHHATGNVLANADSLLSQSRLTSEMNERSCILAGRRCRFAGKCLRSHAESPYHPWWLPGFLGPGISWGVNGLNSPTPSGGGPGLIRRFSMGAGVFTADSTTATGSLVSGDKKSALA